MLKVVNPPVVALNEMLTSWLNSLGGTNAILLGLILGGMMAIDMGDQLIKRHLHLVSLQSQQGTLVFTQQLWLVVWYRH